MKHILKYDGPVPAETDKPVEGKQYRPITLELSLSAAEADALWVAAGRTSRLGATRFLTEGYESAPLPPQICETWYAALAAIFWALDREL